MNRTPVLPWHAELDRIVASYAGATSAPDPTHLEAQIRAAWRARCARVCPQDPYAQGFSAGQEDIKARLAEVLA